VRKGIRVWKETEADAGGPSGSVVQGTYEHRLRKGKKNCTVGNRENVKKGHRRKAGQNCHCLWRRRGY